MLYTQAFTRFVSFGITGAFKEFINDLNQLHTKLIHLIHCHVSLSSSYK